MAVAASDAGRRPGYGEESKSRDGEPMTAYVIAEVEVADPEAYKTYVAATPASIARYGGRFLVRGGSGEALEGAAPKRIVVLEFASREAARRWYESPEYSAARALRETAATVRLFIVEGVLPG
jgi:uncharacterized protein (DUF1330 family)